MCASIRPAHAACLQRLELRAVRQATIAACSSSFPKIKRPWRATAVRLRGLPALTRGAQPAFRATGGLHATALFDAEGTLLVAPRGRRPAQRDEKVLGHALRAGWLPLDRHILLVSGRVSFEIMQKALAARVSVVAGISATDWPVSPA